MVYGTALFNEHVYADSSTIKANLIAESFITCTNVVRLRYTSASFHVTSQISINTALLKETSANLVVTTNINNTSLRIRTVLCDISATSQISINTALLKETSANLVVTTNVVIQHCDVYSNVRCSVLLDTTATCFAVSVLSRGSSVECNVSVTVASNALLSSSVDVAVAVVAIVKSVVTCFTEATIKATSVLILERSFRKLAVFGTALAFTTAAGEYLTIPSENVLYSEKGTLEFMASVNSVTSTEYRYIFDGAGSSNNNLQVFVNTDGNVSVVYGTGSGTVELSGFMVKKDIGYWVAVTWSSDGVTLCVDGSLISQSNEAPDIVFGSNVYVGSCSDGTKQLDGYIDELRFSSRNRTSTEISSAHNLMLPLDWDIDTTYLLHFDGDLIYPADRQNVWVSPIIHTTEVDDYSSLVIEWTSTNTHNTTVTCQVRTSEDGENWSEWYDQINNEFSEAPPAPYVQVRFILQELSNAETPTLHNASVIYEGSPTAEQIATNLSVADKYTFVQLRDSLYICNGVDLPKKYDGIAVTDVTNAPRAFVVCAYKNRLFMAKTATDKSRLFFSDLSDLEVWPADYFIDVNPNDGDEIMALLPTTTTLLVVKQHTTYQLQGYSPETFQVSKLGEGGAVSPWGIIWTPKGVFRIDNEGVWVTDFRRSELLTRKIQKMWDSVNKRALSDAALFYYNDKLLVAVPDGLSSGNNLLLVYDLIHDAWVVWDNWYPACFTTYWERGKWTYVFGSSVSGNVYHIGDKSDDAGSPFSTSLETAHLPFMSEDVLKRFKWVDVYMAGGKVDTEVSVKFVVDGDYSAARTFTVPANSEGNSYRLYPPPYGRVLGINVEMTNTSSDGATLLGMQFAYYPRATRPTRVV